MYVDKLGHTANKYNNKYHSTIKIKPADVKPSTYIDFDKKINIDYPEFKVSNNVRISKYIFFTLTYLYLCSLYTIIWT